MQLCEFCGFALAESPFTIVTTSLLQCATDQCQDLESVRPWGLAEDWQAEWARLVQMQASTDDRLLFPF